MAEIIAITNQKGGVGKTTTAAALIASLSEGGYRVLGVDLDPQGNLGFSLGVDIENVHTMYEVFKKQLPIDQAICTATYGDLLASNILLSGVELECNKPGREYMLKTELSLVSARYDYIIIDTPPALNLLTVNAYVSADKLIIPMAPEILSLLGVTQIKETIETVRQYYNPSLKVIGILLNKFNARLNLNRDVLELSQQIAQQLDTKVFESKIRQSVMVAEAPAHGESIVTYSPTCKPAMDFVALVDEILADKS